MHKKLICINCGKEHPLEPMFEGCPSCRTEGFRSNLVVDYDYEKVRDTLTEESVESRAGRGFYKYKELLPIPEEISDDYLLSGETPLISCKNLFPGEMFNLYIKDETRNPTGSFKDRIAGIGVPLAKSWGHEGVIAGGGNMAASAAAYSAIFAIPLISFETPGESRELLLQTLSLGGKIIPLKNYKNRYNLMKRCVREYNYFSLSSYTASPTTDPYSQEGPKTISYEICRELNWKAPDMVIVPAGQGFCLGAVWKGFKDLHEVGLVDNLPRMVAAESSAGGSFSDSMENDTGYVSSVKTKDTVAKHAIAPRGSFKGYKALKDSDGCAIKVYDEEVISAVRDLARREGIFPSTTSATVLAALREINEKEDLAGMNIVLVVTAGGLKDLNLLPKKMKEIPERVPVETWRDFTSLLGEKYGLEF